jgi:magnesium-transporting ATPase (P-type)
MNKLTVNMRQLILGILALATCTGMLAQDSEYYKAIQKGAPTQISAKQFKQIEQDALRDYSRPETYEVLATAFANTTEKVWGVVYGETFCNLSSDSE